MALCSCDLIARGRLGGFRSVVYLEEFFSRRVSFQVDSERHRGEITCVFVIVLEVEESGFLFYRLLVYFMSLPLKYYVI